MNYQISLSKDLIPFVGLTPGYGHEWILWPAAVYLGVTPKVGHFFATEIAANHPLLGHLLLVVERICVCGCLYIFIVVVVSG